MKINPIHNVKLLSTLLLSGLIVTAVPAQRAYQQYWIGKMKEMEEPEMVEDDAPPLNPDDERYLAKDNVTMGWAATVFPGGEVSEGDPVAQLALRSYVEGAYSYERSGSPQSLAAFSEALRKDPENLYFKQRVADFALRVNDVSRAESLYQEILEVDPENVQAMNGLGQIMTMRRKQDEAVSWFEKAHAIKPRNLEALQNLVQLSQDLESTRTYAQKILAVDDGNAYGLLYNADANARLGNVQDAALFYERLIRYRPQMLKQMEETARQLQSMGRAEDAVVLFERAMLISPGNPALRLSWENSLRSVGGETAVAEAYKRIVAESKDDLKLYELYAEYLSRVRQWDDLVELRKKMLEINPTDVNSLLDLGRYYGALGDNEAARPYYELALSSGGAAPDTFRIVASSYMMQGEFDKAAELFEKALNLNPSDIESLQGLASIAVRNGDYKAAEERLRAAIDLSPANPQLSKALGLLYRQQGEEQKAADQFQAVIAADHEDIDAWLSLASIYFERNNVASLDTLEKQAGDMLNGSPSFYIRYGVLAQKFGMLERSRSALQRAVTATPFDLQARRALSQTYVLLGEPDLAVKTLEDIEQFIAGSPRRDDILAAKNAALGWLLLEIGRYEQAEKTFAAVIDTDPNELGLREPYLLSLIRQDKDEDVKRELNAVIRQFSPDQPIETQLLRSQVFLEQGDAARALSILRQLQSENPDHKEVMFRLAMTAGENKDIPLAEEMYSKLIEMGPPPENTYYEVASNNLGYLLAQQTERFDDAERLVKQALAVNPSAAYILDSIGVVYFKKGEYEKARQYLEQAARIEHNDAEILTNLGQVYERIGERELARASYEKALKVDPKMPLARERMDALGVTD